MDLNDSGEKKNGKVDAATETELSATRFRNRNTQQKDEIEENKSGDRRMYPPSRVAALAMKWKSILDHMPGDGRRQQKDEIEENKSGEKSPRISGDKSLDTTPLMIGKEQMADKIKEMPTVTPSRQDTLPIEECMPPYHKYTRYQTPVVSVSGRGRRMYSPSRVAALAMKWKSLTDEIEILDHIPGDGRTQQKDEIEENKSGEKSPRISGDKSLDTTPLMIGKEQMADKIKEMPTVTPSRQDTLPIEECMPPYHKYTRYQTPVVSVSGRGRRMYSPSRVAALAMKWKSLTDEIEILDHIPGDGRTQQKDEIEENKSGEKSPRISGDKSLDTTPLMIGKEQMADKIKEMPTVTPSRQDTLPIEECMPPYHKYTRYQTPVVSVSGRGRRMYSPSRVAALAMKWKSLTDEIEILDHIPGDGRTQQKDEIEENKSGEKSPMPMVMLSGFSGDKSLDTTPLMIGKEQMADKIKEMPTVTPSRQDTLPIEECMPPYHKYTRYQNPVVSVSGRGRRMYSPSLVAAMKSASAEILDHIPGDGRTQQKDEIEENKSEIGDGELDHDEIIDTMVQSFANVSDKVNKILSFLAQEKGFKPLNERLVQLKQELQIVLTDTSIKDCTNCLNTKKRFNIVAVKMSKIYALFDEENDFMLLLNSFMTDNFGIGLDNAAGPEGTPVLYQKVDNSLYVMYLKDIGDPFEYDVNGKWVPMLMVIKSIDFGKVSAASIDFKHLLRFRRNASRMETIIKSNRDMKDKEKQNKKQVKEKSPPGDMENCC